MSFPVAALTDAFEYMSLPDALDLCAEPGAMGGELGGGYSPAPHVARAGLVASAPTRRGLQTKLRDPNLDPETGVEVSLRGLLAASKLKAVFPAASRQVTSGGRESNRRRVKERPIR